MDNASLMERVGLKYFADTEICRLCLGKISSDQKPQKCKPKLVSTLIKEINYSLNIVVSQDTLCTKICVPCAANVRKFFNYKRLVTRCDEKFKKLLTKSKFKVSPISTVEITIENVKQEPGSVRIKQEVTDEFSETQEASPESDDNTPLIPPSRKKKFKQKRSTKKELANEIICEVCDLTFSAHADLTKHNLETHGQENSIYKCCGCGRRYNSKNSKRQHEIYHCHELKDGYFCQTCNQRLPSWTELKEHKYNHANDIPVVVTEAVRFQCSECDESFGIKGRLIKHLQSHFMTKKYVCETCGRAFAKKDYLDKHADIHAGIRRHQCPHCAFSARQVTTLLIHIRKHTGERPYHCDLCPRKCVTSSNLAAHRKRHLGIKQYQCTICGKFFGYKDSLTEHVTVVHGQSKNFVCPVCGAAYARRRIQRRHMLAKHPGVSWPGIMRANNVDAMGVPSVGDGDK